MDLGKVGPSLLELNQTDDDYNNRHVVARTVEVQMRKVSI